MSISEQEQIIAKVEHMEQLDEEESKRFDRWHDFNVNKSMSEIVSVLKILANDSNEQKKKVSRMERILVGLCQKISSDYTIEIQRLIEEVKSA